MSENMQIIERYQLILKQALDEMKPALAGQEPDEHTDLAFALGDVLYRLCIEHGVEYNGFRDIAIDLISREKPVLSGARRPSKAFGAGFEKFHPLILLALETMPPDSAS